jgi:hypothetical protein
MSPGVLSSVPILDMAASLLSAITPMMIKFKQWLTAWWLSGTVSTSW